MLSNNHYNLNNIEFDSNNCIQQNLTSNIVECNKSLTIYLCNIFNENENNNINKLKIRNLLLTSLSKSCNLFTIILNVLDTATINIQNKIIKYCTDNTTINDNNIIDYFVHLNNEFVINFGTLVSTLKCIKHYIDCNMLKSIADYSFYKNVICMNINNKTIIDLFMTTDLSINESYKTLLTLLIYYKKNYEIDTMFNILCNTHMTSKFIDKIIDIMKQNDNNEYNIELIDICLNMKNNIDFINEYVRFYHTTNASKNKEEIINYLTINDQNKMYLKLLDMIKNRNMNEKHINNVDNDERFCNIIMYYLKGRENKLTTNNDILQHIWLYDINMNINTLEYYINVLTNKKVIMKHVNNNNVYYSIFVNKIMNENNDILLQNTPLQCTDDLDTRLKHMSERIEIINKSIENSKNKLQEKNTINNEVNNNNVNNNNVNNNNVNNNNINNNNVNNNNVNNTVVEKINNNSLNSPEIITKKNKLILSDSDSSHDHNSINTDLSFNFEQPILNPDIRKKLINYFKDGYTGTINNILKYFNEEEEIKIEKEVLKNTLINMVKSSLLILTNNIYRYNDNIDSDNQSIGGKSIKSTRSIRSARSTRSVKSTRSTRTAKSALTNVIIYSSSDNDSDSDNESDNTKDKEKMTSSVSIKSDNDTTSISTTLSDSSVSSDTDNSNDSNDTDSSNRSNSSNESIQTKSTKSAKSVKSTKSTRTVGNVRMNKKPDKKIKKNKNDSNSDNDTNDDEENDTKKMFLNFLTKTAEQQEKERKEKERKERELEERKKRKEKKTHNKNDKSVNDDEENDNDTNDENEVKIKKKSAIIAYQPKKKSKPKMHNQMNNFTTFMMGGSSNQDTLDVFKQMSGENTGNKNVSRQNTSRHNRKKY